MPARTELDRLAAARPPLLDHTDLVIDPAAEEQLLRHILNTPRASGGRQRATIRRHSLRPATAIAAAASVVAVGAAGVLVRSAVDDAHAPGRRVVKTSSAAPARLPGLRIMAARAEAALASVSRTGILYVHTVYAPGTTIGGTAVLETWTRGTSNREMMFSASGGLLSDASAVITGGQRVRRFVDYQTRSWQTDSIAVSQFGPDPSASQRMAQILGPMRPVKLQTAPGTHRPDNPSRTIAEVTVQGKPMILVTFSYPRPFGGNGGSEPLPMLGSAEELPAAAANGGAVSTTMIWIDATSYLPVRAQFATANGAILGSETYSWLSDSAANRAMLAPAPVPAGFRHTAEVAH